MPGPSEVNELIEQALQVQSIAPKGTGMEEQLLGMTVYGLSLVLTLEGVQLV